MLHLVLACAPKPTCTSPPWPQFLGKQGDHIKAEQYYCRSANTYYVANSPRMVLPIFMYKMHIHWEDLHFLSSVVSVSSPWQGHPCCQTSLSWLEKGIICWEEAWTAFTECASKNLGGLSRGISSLKRLSFKRGTTVLLKAWTRWNSYLRLKSECEMPVGRVGSELGFRQWVGERLPWETRVQLEHIVLQQRERERDTQVM